jgi:3-deoxy-D-manno-octulosonic-acid transferase
MYFLYSVLTAAGMLLLLPYFLVQGLRRGKYLHNVVERLGAASDSVRPKDPRAPGAIWLHAVSVGEALAALPLARRIRQQFPERRLVVSTTTATGQRLARERMDFADAVFYFPLDWDFAVRRALEAVRPALIVVLETEIWPNFLREARRAGVPVVFVNGRISERSFRRYQRAFRYFGFVIRGFLRRVLADARLYLMQTEADAQRLRELGAPAERVVVAGNMKYDLAPRATAPVVDWLENELRRHDRRPVIVAGSVTQSEEALVLIAFGIPQGQFRRALLVMAPRKPERFDAAARLTEESHRKVLRRSQIILDRTAPTALPEDVSVLLLDSVGELAGFYRLADAVFVGGSLVPAGGHNILEPAAFGKPPLFGSSMENFSEMAAKFLESGAGVQVDSPEALGVAWIELIQDGERRERMGAAARALVESNRGATERALDAIASILKNSESETAADPVAESRAARSSG